MTLWHLPEEAEAFSCKGIAFAWRGLGICLAGPWSSLEGPLNLPGGAVAFASKGRGICLDGTEHLAGGAESD